MLYKCNYTHSVKDRLVEVFCFTCYDHHANSEDPLVVGFSGDVAEPHGGHAGHREVQRCNVHRLLGGPVYQFRCAGVVRPHVRVGTLGDVGQLPEPTVLDAVVGVRSSYRIPNASQPVSHQHVEAEQKD